MNKKEVTEIKKQFTPSNCAITRICGCYVDGEKEKKTEMKDAFLSLPEEEMFKYFDIFRKSLSGTIGKNLLNMEFPLETESEGGTQEFLLKLRNSRLTDDALLEEFYNRVIDSYDYAETSPLLHRFGVFPLLLCFNHYSQCRHTSYSLVAGRRCCRLGTNYPDAYSSRTFG